MHLVREEVGAECGERLVERIPAEIPSFQPCANLEHGGTKKMVHSINIRVPALAGWLSCGQSPEWMR